MLLYIALLVVSTIVGAVGFRLRGGLFNDKIKWGATTARFVGYALPMSIMTYLCFQPVLWSIPIFVVTWWLGTILGWWKSIDMGRREGSFWTDFALQSIRGSIFAIPTAAALAFLVGLSPALLIMVIGGLSCGICYEIGWRLADKKSIMGGTEYGEFIFGGALGATMAIASFLV